MTKLFITFLTAIFLGIVCTGCSVNPVTGENQFLLVSPEDEKQMGEEYSKEVEKELGQSVNDVQIQNYINSIGQKIARICHSPEVGFSYKAIDHNSVNAFALPGGYIYITTGLLKELGAESQLAGILAHETAHVTARHIAQQITRDYLIGIGFTVASYKVSSGALRVADIVRQLESMSFSRSEERQADTIGMDYMVKAGYTPYGMVETMEILQKQDESRTIEFFSTHPSPENRIGYLKEHIFNNRYPNTGTVGKEEYASNITERLKLIKPPPKDKNSQ
ncbi:MAG: M48 family metalloprotease [Sedimentisphaerales bacterium]|nr:M48 family metalloprotease [Sedimentisphaerales bacterium]